MGRQAGLLLCCLHASKSGFLLLSYDYSKTSMVQTQMKHLLWLIDCMLANCSFFLSSADFSKSIFSKNSFRNAISVSNSLDPDQA